MNIQYRTKNTENYSNKKHKYFILFMCQSDQAVSQCIAGNLSESEFKSIIELYEGGIREGE